LILKIAYFVNQYPKVSHTFIRREILALERRGFDIQRIALRGWSEILHDPTDRQEQGKTRYLLRQAAWGLVIPSLCMLLWSPLRLLRALRLAVRISWQSDRRLIRHIVRVAEACRLVPWLRKSRAMRLHAHFGTNSAEVAMYGHCLGGPPFSFTVHGPEEFEAPMSLDRKVREASFVSAISCYCVAQLYMRCRTTEWPKIKIVRCGLESSFFQAAASEPAQSRRLICVGRLCEAKGQLLLIDAAARLRADGITFELVLAGDGPHRSEIEGAIARHGLNDAVRITGWISSNAVRDEILSARALVLPSFSEGLPVVIMEALALRKPVLSTFVAGIPELVQPGENGWLFPAGSLEALIGAMTDCLSRPVAEIQRMVEAGYRKVLELHSIDTECAKLADLFHAPSPTA